MKLLPVLLLLAVSCRCSDPPAVAPAPVAVAGPEMIRDLSSAAFSDDDFKRLGLDGAWVYRAADQELDLRFRVLHGKLVVDGPLGDFVGGLVDGVIVLRMVSDGDGSPVEHWLNLGAAADGTLEGWRVDDGAAPGTRIAVVLGRR